jgi:hypothetical protein
MQWQFKLVQTKNLWHKSLSAECFESEEVMCHAPVYGTELLLCLVMDFMLEGIVWNYKGAPEYQHGWCWELAQPVSEALYSLQTPRPTGTIRRNDCIRFYITNRLWGVRGRRRRRHERHGRVVKVTTYKLHKSLALLPSLISGQKMCNCSLYIQCLCKRPHPV